MGCGAHRSVLSWPKHQLFPTDELQWEFVCFQTMDVEMLIFLLTKKKFRKRVSKVPTLKRFRRSNLQKKKISFTAPKHFFFLVIYTKPLRMSYWSFISNLDNMIRLQKMYLLVNSLHSLNFKEATELWPKQALFLRLFATQKHRW